MAASVPYYTFVAGVNTEASPLTYPDNTLSDADNVVLNRDGSIRSRLGMEYEDGYTRVGPILDATGGLPVTNIRASKMATGLGTWTSVGGNGSLEFTVVQMGNVLYFHDATRGAVSPQQKAFTVDLDDFRIISISYLDKVEFANGDGYLFVAGPQINPFYITYSSDTDTITTTQIDIRIRDFEGVDDGLDIDTRPGTISTNHLYNLRNQGWAKEFLCSTDPVNASSKDHAYLSEPTQLTFNTLGEYPSNADVMSMGYTAMANGTQAYWPHELTASNVGTTPAPKGRYVVDAFNIDRSSPSEVFGIPNELEVSRPSTIEFYAGRVWYSGLEVGNNNGKVFFSQLVESESRIPKCYQEADPTSDQVSDLVATDGGVISITDAGEIRKLKTVGRSILVFASNGVWEITGIDGSFNATGYSINKVGEQGTDAKDSIVAAESQVYYIGKDGLYRLIKEDFGTNFKLEDISSTTIQSLLNDISPFGKDFSLGVYDPEERRITWFFNDTTNNDGESYRFIYNRMLVFDILLNAFFPLTLDVVPNFPIVGGVIASNRFNFTGTNVNVEASADQVQIGGIDVFLESSDVVKDPLKYKFLSIWRDKWDGFYYYTFAEFKNTSVRDWQAFNGAGLTYPAFFETGYILAGDASLYKQIQYIFTFVKRTETGYEYNSKGELVYTDPSSLFLQVKWDWSNTPAANKWSQKRQVYRYKRFYQPQGVTDPLDYGKVLLVSKSKVRGRGRALQIRFENEPGNNFHIYGWHVFYTGSPKP